MNETHQVCNCNPGYLIDVTNVTQVLVHHELLCHIAGDTWSLAGERWSVILRGIETGACSVPPLRVHHSKDKCLSAICSLLYMEDMVEPSQSDFDRKHSQLPSVELPHRARTKQWDYGIKQEEHSVALKKPHSPVSRIPRPLMHSQNAAAGDAGTPSSLHLPAAAVADGLPSSGSVREINGFENPVFSAEQEKTANTRQPRYGMNLYKSYEEMLGNMESDDPFAGQPPLPKAKESQSSKSHARRHDIALEQLSQRTPSSHHRTHITHVSAPPGDSRHGRKKKSQKAKQAADAEAGSESKDLKSTYTLEDSENLRRGSAGSAGTFTIPGRSDSRTCLVANPTAVEPTLSQKQPPQGRDSSETIKKVRVDARELTLRSTDLPNTMDEVSAADTIVYCLPSSSTSFPV